MALLAGGDLTKLETRPHTAKVAVDFITPDDVLEGTLPAGDDQHNVVELSYIGGVGTPGDVLDGMPAYFYDASDNLKGIVRTKSADGSKIYIAENDEITFQATDYFIVKKIFLIWPKFQTADVSGDDPIFYKDYDVAYTDQNQYPPPVPILGPHVRCQYLEGAADVDVDWDASDSYGLDSGVTVTGYSWDFEGGAPGASAVAAPTITYNTPGQYLTTLTITDSNGKTSVAYRWIIIRDYQADSQAVKHDISLRGSFRGGGWSADIATRGGPTLDDLPDGSPVAVTCEGMAGDGELDFGRFTGEHRLYFCGWLQKDTVDVAPGGYEVRFSAATADHIMSQLFSFDCFVYDVNTTPANWLEIYQLSVREAGYHLLRWHSNILELIDVYLPDDDTRTAGIDAPEGNLFDQLKNMFQRVRQLATGCNNQGALYVQKNVQHMLVADRTTYDYNHQMQRTHYQAGITWARKHFARMAMLELQAVAWDGSDPLPFFGRAPGIVPVHEGKIKEITGLAVADQAECNELAGMFFSDANNYQTGITFTMAGNWLPALDVFPQAMVILPIGLTIRGWSVSTQWAVVREIAFTIIDNGAPTTAWSVDVMVDEVAGRSFFYPDPEDVAPYDPPYNPPYVPPYFPPVPPMPPGGTPARVHVSTYNAGVWATDDITEASPTWTNVNAGLAVGAGLEIQHIARDPLTPRERMYLQTYSPGIYRNDTLDVPGAWSSILSGAEAQAAWGGTSPWIFNALKPQVSVPGRIWVFGGHPYAGWPMTTYLIWSDDFGETWSAQRTYQSCATFNTQVGLTNLVPSPHTWQHVWVFGNAGLSVFQKNAAIRVIEGDMQHPSTLQWGAGNWGLATLSGHIPYADNADESRIYLPSVGVPAGTLTYRADTGLWEPGTTRATTCDPANQKVLTNITPGFSTIGNNPKLFGSYTEDKDRIWFVDPAGICGVSNDAGDTWTQKATVPFNPRCASGFPTNSSYFFIAHQQTHWDAPSIPMIMASADGGDTWEDKTGDLFDEIKLFMSGGYNFETGITTIAPEY